MYGTSWAESMSEHESPSTSSVLRCACSRKNTDDALYAVALVNEVIGGSGHKDFGALRTNTGGAAQQHTPGGVAPGRTHAGRTEDMERTHETRGHASPVSAVACAVVESIAADGDVLRQCPMLP